MYNKMSGDNKQAIMEELNGIFNDANKKQLFVDKIAKNYNIDIHRLYAFNHKYIKDTKSTRVDILFCYIYITKRAVIKYSYNDDNKPASYKSADKYEKCGIEILKEVDNTYYEDDKVKRRRNKYPCDMRRIVEDNKYKNNIKYDKNKKCVQNYYTNQELKEKCKMNAIKGYSKMKKLQLIKSLMNI